MEETAVTIKIAVTKAATQGAAHTAHPPMIIKAVAPDTALQAGTGMVTLTTEAVLTKALALVKAAAKAHAQGASNPKVTNIKAIKIKVTQATKAMATKARATKVKATMPSFASEIGNSFTVLGWMALFTCSFFHSFAK